MNELAYNCTIYIKTEPDENLDNSITRLERIIATTGLDCVANYVALLDENRVLLEEREY